MSLSSTPSPSGRGKEPVTPSPSRRRKSPGDLLGSGKSQKYIHEYFSQSSEASLNLNSTSNENVTGSSSSERRRRKRRVKVLNKENRSKRLNVLSSDDSDDSHMQGGYNAFISGDLVASSSICGMTKRRLFSTNEVLSQTQAIVISSSDDSDFELHRSKKSCDASSQLMKHEVLDESQHRPTILARKKKKTSVVSSPDNHSYANNASSSGNKTPNEDTSSSWGGTQFSEPVTSGETRTSVSVASGETQPNESVAGGETQNCEYVTSGESQPNESIASGETQTCVHVTSGESQPNESVASGDTQTCVYVTSGESQPNESLASEDTQTCVYVTSGGSQPNESVASEETQPNESVAGGETQTCEYVTSGESPPNESMTNGETQTYESMTRRESQLEEFVDSGETQPNESAVEQVGHLVERSASPKEAVSSLNQLHESSNRLVKQTPRLPMTLINNCSSSCDPSPALKLKFTFFKNSEGSWQIDSGTGADPREPSSANSLETLQNAADIFVISSDEDIAPSACISILSDSDVPSFKCGTFISSNDSLSEVKEPPEPCLDSNSTHIQSFASTSDALQIGNIVEASDHDSWPSQAHSGSLSEPFLDSNSTCIQSFASTSDALQIGNIVEASDHDSCPSQAHSGSLSEHGSKTQNPPETVRDYIDPRVSLGALKLSSLHSDNLFSPQREMEDEFSASCIFNTKHLRVLDQSRNDSNDTVPLSTPEVTDIYAETTIPFVGLPNITHISDSDCESDLDILPSTPQPGFPCTDVSKSPETCDLGSSRQFNSSEALDLDASADFFSEVVNSIREETSFASENVIIDESIKSKGSVEPEQVQVYRSGEDVSDAESSIPNSILMDLGATQDGVLDIDGCGAKLPKFDAAGDTAPNNEVTEMVPANEESMRITCEPQHVFGSPERMSDHPPSTSGQAVSNTSVNEGLVLDVLLAEGKNFAAPIFQLEPVSTFAAQYSTLTSEEHYILHGYLMTSIKNSNLWLQRSDTLPFNRLDRFISVHIFEYVSAVDTLNILDLLSVSEMTKVLHSLAKAVPEKWEEMKSLLIQLHSDDPVKTNLAIKAVAYKKFFHFTGDALLSIKICLELFSMCLNLNEKLYKSYDIACYLNKLVGDVRGSIPLLPIQTSSAKLFASEYEVREFLSLCKMKNCMFEPNAHVNSVQRMNDICASLAVGASSVGDNLCLQYVFTNYVYALDEELKKVGMGTTSETEFCLSLCFYLGVLLNQNIAGHSLKTEWCRWKLKCLSKLCPLSTVEKMANILTEKVSPVEFIVRSEFVSKLLENKKFKLSVEDKSKVSQILKPSNHRIILISESGVTNKLANIYPVVGKKINGRILNLKRACIFSKYSVDYPNGLQDSGALLINTVYLVFWEAIYSRIDGVFVSKFQKCPLDWGLGGFYEKRRTFIDARVRAMRESGLEAVVTLMSHLSSNFSGNHCVVDWQVVSSYFPQMTRILEVLGLNKFFPLAIYLLQNLNERIHGFPDLVVWNDVSVKFIGTKKAADPLYPHQVVWLEKLTEFGIEAEECQFQL